MHFRYRKPFELSARRDARSGKLSHNIIPFTHWPISERTIIMLIHGFNTDQREADEGYFHLLNNLRKAGMPDYFLPRVCQFYWPGNLSNLFSRPSYFIQVKKAQGVANMLADYLQELPRQTDIVFIGHSLGCRLILETIKLILGNTAGPIDIKSVQLLAAAVPVPMVSEKGNLFNLSSQRERISGIFSRKDSVLRDWFPLGQWAAREGRSEAVGLNGNPANLWKDPMESQNDHNDYWTDQATAAFLATKLAIPAKRVFPKNTISQNKTSRHQVENIRLLKRRKLF
jgi:pimeloyl-ACP methyl ester carboxylesterase